MFLSIDNKDRFATAALDSSGGRITYGQLASFTKEFAVKSRAVVFCLCENDIGAFAGLFALIENKAVPLLLSEKMNKDMLSNLLNIYAPAYIWCRSNIADEFGYACAFEAYGYKLLRTDNELYPLFDDLAMLLTTSGSTGSPKLVRHSFRNISETPKNTAKFFNISENCCAMADLPIHHTMGLSVICSHISAGAKVLLNSLSLMEAAYWDFFKEHKPTTFTGVPYSYEVLKRLRFTSSAHPQLQVLTQGGGKLSEELYLEFASYASNTGKKFIPTFGMTECTARMAGLAPELALEKVCAIGHAIPGGRLFLTDNDGTEIETAEATGEMGFEGPGVTLGYSECRSDLQKGDERCGRILTGDIAKRDASGVYFVLGRQTRFLKLLGFRINLDECEKLIKREFATDSVCVGNDKKMMVYVEKQGIADKVPAFLSKHTGIGKPAFAAQEIAAIPRNSAGKILYSELRE
ncbi:MAG: AMP-binding protein [Oscillospiraceae bacterium]|nr:AMP-binding protein [Oscillospiraceae bacterium]